MWLFSLFLLVTSAFSADVSDIRTPTSAHHYAHSSHQHTQRSKPLKGTLSLENAVRNMGYKLEDLEMLQAQYTEGIEAPQAALVARRHKKWSSRFGQSTLKVNRQRVVDQEILAEASAARTSQNHSKPICTTSDAKDTRQLVLSTFGDLRSNKRIEKETPSTQTTEHQVFYLADQTTRTAVAHLKPGESMTVVEVIGNTKKQPKNRIVLRQKTHTMSITESNTEQVVCITQNIL